MKELHMEELQMKELQMKELQMKELQRDHVKEILTSRIRELQEMISYLTDQNIGLPKGVVHATASKGNYQYRLYHADSGQRTYISKKDPQQIHNYLQREYNERVIEQLQQQIAVLQNCLQNYGDIENCFAELCQAKQSMIYPIYLPDDLFIKRWLETPYGPKEIDSDEPEYYTDLEERVRSKSEIIIANRLHAYHIPYKYECPLKLRNGRIVYPDFTCLSIKNRREIIWEHFGKMSDSTYVDKALRKIDGYAKSGWILGVNFLATFETAEKPLNNGILNQIIESAF